MWGESKVKEKMREMEWKRVLNLAAPIFTVHWAFLDFLQNYSFATTLSNSVYRTTLRFFDVPDSFLLLF